MLFKICEFKIWEFKICVFKIFRQFKQISINNQQKKGLCSKLLLLSLFLFGHSISVSLSDELFQLRGSFKLMYTWVLPDDKKKIQNIRAHAKFFSNDIHFFKSKKGRSSLYGCSVFMDFTVFMDLEKIFLDFHRFWLDSNRFQIRFQIWFQIQGSIGLFSLFMELFRVPQSSRILALGFESDSKFCFADLRISTSLFIYL